MTTRGIAWIVAAGLAMSGCASLREDPTRCRIVTGVSAAAIGALIGAVATSATDADAGEIVAAGVGGAAVGALVGIVLGSPVCGSEAPSAPSTTAPPPQP